MPANALVQKGGDMKCLVKAVVLLLCLAVLLSGLSCTAASPQIPTWADKVERAWTVGHPENWDADAENDGIRIWIELQDSDENEIEYSNMSMPVAIQVYSTESVTYPWEKARVIYSVSGTLTDWDDDAFVSSARGVKDIPWEAISTPLPTEQQEYGMLYVTVTLPNGKQYSAEYDPIRIKEG